MMTLGGQADHSREREMVKWPTLYERPRSAKDSPASREVTAMRWCSTTSCASRSLVYTKEVRTI
jgi:hypothetical protein